MWVKITPLPANSAGKLNEIEGRFSAEWLSLIETVENGFMPSPAGLWLAKVSQYGDVIKLSFASTVDFDETVIIADNEQDFKYLVMCELQGIKADL